MKIVLSPAKSLDFKSQLPTTEATLPKYIGETEKNLHFVLVKKSKKELQKLMSISDALAELNIQRYRKMTFPFTPQNARPAMYAFAGDVYVGLDAYSIPKEKINFAQDTLRILSGFYGILKPLDLIQPYRLEMGTDLKTPRKKNLYEFWGNKITDALNEEMEKDEILLNLASVEYFKAVNAKKLNAKVVSPEFKDFKNGQLKIISFFAKKARGLMSRYVIDNGITTSDDILNFDYEGYHFSKEHTKSVDKPVFIR